MARPSRGCAHANRLVKWLFRCIPSQLITQTRLGIAEIAVECGFHDHSAFRSATGKAPSRFRGR